MKMFKIDWKSIVRRAKSMGSHTLLCFAVMMIGIIILTMSGIMMEQAEVWFQTGIVIVTGGIFALLYGLLQGPPKDEEILEELKALRAEINELRRSE